MRQWLSLLAFVCSACPLRAVPTLPAASSMLQSYDVAYNIHAQCAPITRYWHGTVFQVNHAAAFLTLSLPSPSAELQLMLSGGNGQINRARAVERIRDKGGNRVLIEFITIGNIRGEPPTEPGWTPEDGACCHVRATYTAWVWLNIEKIEPGKVTVQQVCDADQLHCPIIKRLEGSQNCWILSHSFPEP
ncbi:hypothetical protein E5Q_05771 [Mixia osmundae IAM 14324]|uniref:Phosphatidylglycerol/phosphatidylinositol transfer protein n=1 Tax=Mixia osmundae (strain CBS 9802 / IAM 14324 / JCM 22182 / KY 12970) TaxID=764103 RepID=G7E8C2_MIXOS|nr:hypothetical protein E5Q_05771 [Mixia osmundae IAM 14324]